MKRIIQLLGLFLTTLCYGESADIVGISKEWFALIDKHHVGQYTNVLNRVEGAVVTTNILRTGTNGGKESDSNFLNMLDSKPRVYLLSSIKNTNDTYIVLAMPPYPLLEKGNFSYVDSYIFDTQNRIDLKVSPLKKKEFERIAGNLFIWRDREIVFKHPRPILNEKSIKEPRGRVKYFVLEDVYSFRTLHAEKRRKDWLSPFRHYEQEIILKEKDTIL